MASTAIPWRRDGNNSWNDLVRRVNEVLENPPDNTDCDPIAPLPEVNECHQWTTQDITDMQNALKEACDTNVFTPVEPCDKWKKSIIDEIEAAILIGFCDCETLDECAPSCDNQGPEEERFLLSETVGPSCTEDLFGGCPTETTASFVLFDDYLIAETAFTTSLSELCVLIKEVEDLEEELDDLTDQRDTECAANPGSALCISLTAQVNDKQTELDDKIVERDAKDTEQSTNRSDMISAAADTANNAIAAVAFGRALSEIDLVVGSPGVPWTNFECDDPLKIPACFGPVDECKASWILERQTVFVTRVSAIGGGGDCNCLPQEPLCAQGQCDPIVRASGFYTIDGTIVVRPFSDCLGRPTIFCSCFPLSNACDITCDQLCSSITGSVDATHEWKLFIAFPAERGAEACNTGVPCVPGA